jgi:hypothetical protein
MRGLDLTISRGCQTDDQNGLRQSEDLTKQRNDSFSREFSGSVFHLFSRGANVSNSDKKIGPAPRWTRGFAERPSPDLFALAIALTALPLMTLEIANKPWSAFP